jgi:hypothetical protein
MVAMMSVYILQNNFLNKDYILFEDLMICGASSARNW